MTKIQFPVFYDKNGSLAVFESGVSGGVPFSIARVFTVIANMGDIRGNHAHYRCAQFLICVSGRIRVECFDGFERSNVFLEKCGEGVLIPPGIWTFQEYLESGSVMMVLCDRPYEPEDYIRDYQVYINYVLVKR